MRDGLGVCNNYIVFTVLIANFYLIAQGVVGVAIKYGEIEVAGLSLTHEGIPLVFPQEHDQGVRRLAGQLHHQLVAAVVHGVDIRAFVAGVGVDRTRGDLQELLAYRGSVQGSDRASSLLVLVGQELLLLHLEVSLHGLGGHGVGHGVDLTLRNLDHVFELVAHSDVGQQAEHCILGTLFVFPVQCVGVAADLHWGAHAVAEGIERIAQARAVVDKIRLMPHVRDGAAGWRARHKPTVGEVFADFGQGL